VGSHLLVTALGLCEKGMKLVVHLFCVVYGVAVLLLSSVHVVAVLLFSSVHVSTVLLLGSVQCSMELG
jgi:hypothetical protein